MDKQLQIAKFEQKLRYIKYQEEADCDGGSRFIPAIKLLNNIIIKLKCGEKMWKAKCKYRYKISEKESEIREAEISGDNMEELLTNLGLAVPEDTMEEDFVELNIIQE